MAEIESTDQTTTTITVHVIGLSGSYNKPTLRTVRWNIDGKYKGSTETIPNGDTESSEFTFTGLTPGTSYRIGAYLTWSGGSNSIFLDVETADAPFGGDIDTKCTTDSISARLVGINTDYPNNKKRVTFYVAGSQVSSFTFTEVPSSGTTKWMTKTGLKPGTRYSVSIEVEDLVTGWSNSWSTKVTTDKIVVAAWDWNASNGDASAALTKAAKYAVDHKGSLSDFSYKVWNDMCKKVLDIENAAGLKWNPKYAEYLDTKMSSTDKVLTADRFNSLRYNIGRSYSTGIDEVNSGWPVLGSYFVTLTDCMNAWINQL